MTFKRDDGSGPDLLGYHLGLLDDAERSQVQADLASSIELQALGSRLSHLLAPLDKDPEASIPGNLVDSILERVDRSQAIPFRPAPPITPPLDRGAPVGGRLFSVRDLMGIAAVITLFVGLFVPGIRTARMNARQAVCADHLRQIGSGYAGYQQTYESEPFVSAIPVGSPWMKRDSGARPHSNNSPNFFALFRTHYVPTAAAHCPGNENDVPFTGDGIEQFRDFPDPRNNSYVTNLVTRPRPTGSVQPNTPRVTDMTPLVDGNRQLISNAPASLNSSSHGASRGQNVLRGDGGVTFTRTPHIGPDSDDIYRVIGVQQYTGVEHPRSSTDVFLVP